MGLAPRSVTALTEDESKKDDECTAVEELILMSQSDCVITRLNAAMSPNITVGLLVAMSADEDYRIRREVARNLNTPVEILVKLSKDEHASVRCVTAENTNLPVELLTKLSEDEEWYVRSSVASNPQTPVEVLEKFCDDDEFIVRDSLHKNPNIPQYIVDRLEAVEEEFSKRLNILPMHNNQKEFKFNDGERESFRRNSLLYYSVVEGLMKFLEEYGISGDTLYSIVKNEFGNFEKFIVPGFGSKVMGADNEIDDLFDEIFGLDEPLIKGH